MDENTSAKWYVVHTYSGYENMVAASIEKSVENRGMSDLIQEVSIPTKTVIVYGDEDDDDDFSDNVSRHITKKTVKTTGPREVVRKLFPSYVMVKMVMNRDTWHMIRNVRGVTGFVGGDSDSDPLPLTDEEVASMGVERREIEVGYEVGDRVKITEGSFESYLGTIEKIDLEHNRVVLSVETSTREIQVDLDLDQVELVED